MAQIEPLTTQLIRQALEAVPWSYEVDEDGEYVVEFETGTVLGEFNAFFTQHGTLLRCWGYFDLPLSGGQIPAAIAMCNDFQVDHYYPAVYVETDPDADDDAAQGLFVTQFCVDLVADIHLEGLTALLLQFTQGSISFAEWIAEQRQLSAEQA